MILTFKEPLCPRTSRSFETAHLTQCPTALDASSSRTKPQSKAESSERQRNHTNHPNHPTSFVPLVIFHLKISVLLSSSQSPLSSAWLRLPRPGPLRSRDIPWLPSQPGAHIPERCCAARGSHLFLLPSPSSHVCGTQVSSCQHGASAQDRAAGTANGSCRVRRAVTTSGLTARGEGLDATPHAVGGCVVWEGAWGETESRESPARCEWEDTGRGATAEAVPGINCISASFTA